MEKQVVRDSYTIREVMEQFEKNHDRVAIVVNTDDKVIGVVSQGDIIRALVSGISQHTVIRNIIQPSFLYLRKKDIRKAYRLFRERKITLIPVVDEKFQLVDFINLDDIFDYLERKWEIEGEI